MPAYIYSFFLGDPKFPKKQEVERKNLPAFEKFISFSTILIYPILSFAVSNNESYAAFGLQDGSVIAWDLHSNIEAAILDKHQAAVSCVQFFENCKVFSGAIDGSVHLSDIERKGKLEMKRTN